VLGITLAAAVISEPQIVARFAPSDESLIALPKALIPPLNALSEPMRYIIPTSRAEAHDIASTLGLGTKKAANELLRGAVPAHWLKVTGLEGQLPGTLAWPVKAGYFTRGFGSGSAGYHLAVDIVAHVGTPVRAAADGVIAYAGSEIHGFGNLIMMVHQGGWVTLYAHNDRIRVAAGQRVPQGTVIADTGNTGISRGPHLHFELLYAGLNCDPMALFRPYAPNRNGDSMQKIQADWTSPDNRPDSVSCAPRKRHPHSYRLAHQHEHHAL